MYTVNDKSPFCSKLPITIFKRLTNYSYSKSHQFPSLFRRLKPQFCLCFTKQSVSTSSEYDLRYWDGFGSNRAHWQDICPFWEPFRGSHFESTGEAGIQQLYSLEGAIPFFAVRSFSTPHEVDGLSKRLPTRHWASLEFHLTIFKY